MRIAPALFASLLVLGTGAAQAKPTLTGEEQIAKALEGRTAGEPTDCIFQRDIRSSRIIDGTAILYEMAGGTIYLNRVASGGGFLRRDNVLVTNTHSSQLCSIDIVRLYDTASRFETGSVGLGPFIPYPRVPRAKRM